MAITDTKARTAKAKEKVYKIPDGAGLYLEVRPTGKKIWRYRFNILKKEGIYTIGKYPEVTLTEARKASRWARKQARAGLSPNEARKSAQQLQQEQTQAQAQADERARFDNVVAEYRGRKSLGWSAAYLGQFDAVMNKDILPLIAKLPIDQIGPRHCLTIIEAIEARGAPTMAHKARQWLSQIFHYAAAKLLVESDPTFVLKGAIIKQPTRHTPPLEEDQLPGFFAALNAYSGHRRTVLAIRILAHTFLRTSELRKGEWCEQDWGKALWTIPGVRMKMGGKHLVPLSRQVRGYLKELHALNGASEFLFPNLHRAGVMSENTINEALNTMGYAKKFSGHGFRSTASTILNERGWREDAIERQLSHAERSGVRRAYNHAKYLDERAQMMQAWSDFLDEQESRSVV